MDKLSTVLQFRIALQDISPIIWRRIVVPEKCSFWDFHVAIQDSMGWLDYHLHEFTVTKPGSEIATIGIPDDDRDDMTTVPGWEIGLSKYFKRPGDRAFYLYDFGDSWGHEVLLEGVLLRKKDMEYPVCVAGERACPPEDCQGTFGYERLLRILGDAAHEEHNDMIDWLKGHAINYYPYDPEYFDPDDVRFDDPNERWKKAFSDNDDFIANP